VFLIVVLGARRGAAGLLLPSVARAIRMFQWRECQYP